MKRFLFSAAFVGLMIIPLVVQAGCSGRSPTNRWVPTGGPSREERENARSRGRADGYAAAIEYLAGHPDPPLVIAVDVPSDCGGFERIECKVEYASAYQAGFQKGLEDRAASPLRPGLLRR